MVVDMSGESLVVLVPEVAVVVHPVDVAVHPTYPPGWRWAVHVGGRRPDELDWCVQAGHEDTAALAWLAGESHGAAACRALRLLGVPAQYSKRELTWDPIPASADQRPLAVWRGREGE